MRVVAEQIAELLADGAATGADVRRIVAEQLAVLQAEDEDPRPPLLPPQPPPPVLPPVDWVKRAPLEAGGAGEAEVPTLPSRPPRTLWTFLAG